MKFSVCSIWRWISGIVLVAEYRSVSACRRSSIPATPPSSRACTRSRDCFREATVRLEISSVRSSARRVRYARPTSVTSVAITT